MRNNWASLRVLKDSVDDKIINWQYITKLNKLQEKGLKATNKLRNSHIRWQQQKVKENLAVQTLSSSGAKALEFYDKN